MIDNYEQLENGVIKQIDKTDIVKYDIDYVDNRYNSYGDLSIRMSYLRLGYIIGSLGFIPNSILDIGYGNGDFLLVGSDIIKKCYGHDVSSYPLPIKENIYYTEHPYDSEYDVVTFFDVLEHFDDIYDIKNLKTNYIVVSVPDCHYYDDDWFMNWKHRRPSEHLWHFDRHSLINFMNEIGYDCISYSNIEDTIRKNNQPYSNILTASFKRI